MSVNTMKQQRFDVLDIAKGIGIFFVVFAHVNYTPFLLTYIYSFHMPMFFVFSGMVFNKDKYDSFATFFKRRLKTLICPYILFYVASLLVMFVLYGVSSGFTNELFKDFLGYIMQMFLSQGSANCLNAPLWFVPCLFVVEIMYYFISKIRGIQNLHIIIICSVLTFCGWVLESGLLPFDNKILPWSIDSALFALGFYALGNIVYGKVKSTVYEIEQSKHKILIAALVAVISVILLVPFVFLNGKISLGSKILNNGFWLYASGITGTIGVLSLAVLFKKSKLLKFCGLNSFYIMSTHYVVRIIYQVVCSLTGIGVYDNTNFVQTIVPFAIVMTVSSVFAYVYVKVKNVVINKI